MAKILIKGYTIERKIKSGGFAEVYRARRMRDKTRVAIKVLSPEGARKFSVVRSFRREAKLLMKLDHPYIIKVYELIKHSPRPAIAMEFFPGETLKTLILQNDPFLDKQGIYIFGKLVQALSYIHNLSIIHKDLKPENILVARNGDVRLIDFSLAEKLNFFSRLRIRKIEGTPLYIAPEQIERKCPDNRTDIYSLGATFYEVFARRPPFQGKTVTKILAKQVRGAVEPIRSHNKATHHQIDRIIKRMLEKSPAKRYQNTAELLFDYNKTIEQIEREQRLS